ncbi:Conserved_hypothetical protein [Hexamita inflata]|uniref:Uncharacterized protein n=1 Tax=Hexamita inflata TaxID=28002 RepID=A0AA86RMV1_9EUKA|nr:Conserved hypothetical protein [Hexamita inflata]
MSQQKPQGVIQVEQNVEKVRKQITDFKQNRIMRNKARQMRTESVASFPFLRDSVLPNDDLYKPFERLEKTSETIRRQHGQTIFDRVKNYLALLAAQSLYPSGDLTQQVIVRILDQQILIQLVPKYLSNQQQPIQQLEDFAKFVFVNCAFPASQQAIDFYYPSDANALFDPQNIQQVAVLVSNITDIDLQANPGKIFICGAQVMSNQEIFEAKYDHFTQENSVELWIILARFCNEHQAINSIDLLPDWINDYVKYDNPIPLPNEFLNQCVCQKQLETLRMMMGLYPTDVKKHDVTSAIIPQPILDVLMQMPVWYQNKVIQLAYLADSFTIGEIDEEGIHVKCPATQEGIKALCRKYT